MAAYCTSAPATTQSVKDKKHVQGLGQYYYVPPVRPVVVVPVPIYNGGFYPPRPRPRPRPRPNYNRDDYYRG